MRGYREELLAPMIGALEVFAGLTLMFAFLWLIVCIGALLT